MVEYSTRTTVLQGGLTSHFYRMGVMPMKNQNNHHFDFKDLMTFGLFLLALLTFVFTFCR
ncbi:MAG: hypothetical protein K2I10_00120 [Lachnospiraceae bacterium]|nr:hypothetical protein [Lachnospiraceae bacterium]